MTSPESAEALAPAVEAQFDGLVGPTHNYAGLARGNLASACNAERPSDPRAAATQGLAKMRRLADLGIAQGVLPPQERPCLPALRALGYAGRDADILRKVAAQDPALLAASSSASSMWVANAATVSPSADSADGRVHFTPANLAAHRHRALETASTARLLRATFADARYFAHHPPLDAATDGADEGAANHLRLAAGHGAPGLELFVYGRDEAAADGAPDAAPQRFAARQTLSASRAVARAHGLDPRRTAFLRQHPAAIDAGAFHNDVVAVSNENLLICHADAYADGFADPAAIVGLAVPALGPEVALQVLAVPAAQLSLAEAVSSYLFNSQLLSLPQGGMALVCAQECAESPRAWALVQRWLDDPAVPLREALVVDLRQSMRNGGGPACLRLRVVLTPAQRAAVNAASWITAERHDALLELVRRYYRDRLESADLADPQLLDESRTVLDRTTQVLGLGSVYDFQRA